MPKEGTPYGVPFLFVKPLYSLHSSFASASVT